MKAGVPVGRFYFVVAIMAVVTGVAAYYAGKITAERKEADITIEMQERVLDVHTQVYGNLPRSRSESFDWLYDHTD